MPDLHPALIIGIGPQAGQIVAHYAHILGARKGPVPAVLAATVELGRPTPGRDAAGIQVLSVPAPAFGPAEAWPTWLPTELARMPVAERMQTRAWMRAALVQAADEIEEFLLERIPHLTSFAAIEEMRAAGMALAGDSEIRVYVIADLGDPLGSSAFIDVAYLAHHVCRQLGLQPAVSGVLSLPPATSPAPAEEAIAYAALKELDHYVERRAYDREWVPDWAPDEELGPFEDGCYLFDAVNELGYTLEDPAQQVILIAEWLYAMTILGIHEAVRARRRRRYATSTLRRRVRPYEGTGIAVRYVPRTALLDWLTARWGGAVAQRMLGERSARDGAARAAAFAARVGLGLDDLRATLRQRAGEGQVEGELEDLQRAPLHQIELRAREALQHIRARHLPALDARLAQASQALGGELQHAIEGEIAATEEGGLDGIVQEREQFLDGVAHRLANVQREVEALSRRHGQALRAALSTVGEAHYALRAVLMSVPPWPISVVSAIGLLLLPLVYVARLVDVVLQPIGHGWSTAVQVVLILGVLGIVAYLGYQLWRRQRGVCAQYREMVQQRYELEGNPLYYAAIGAACASAQEYVDRTRQELSALASALRTVTAQMDRQAADAAERLEALAAPGPFSSAVGRPEAVVVWSRVEGDLERSLQALHAETGSLDTWQERADDAVQPLSSWLCEHLARRGPAHLAPYAAQFGVLDLMAVRAGDAQDDAFQRLIESAQPLWNIDPRTLRRGKTERIVVVGAAPGTAREELSRRLGRDARGRAWVDTRDPNSVVVVRVHRGLPLFALRRIAEYRAHYAEMLWQGKRPLHSTCAMRLQEDLFPAYRGVRYPAAILFATGLALGHIRRDPSGRYLAPRPQGGTIALSRQKDRSVALMSMDGATCGEVQRQLDAVLATKGASAVRTILDEYVTVMPDLKDWEVRAILAFQR
ncbi:MAG: hypothetical protein JXA09_06695 [Anaerolineae bacterium]|nr:hypothetical protein [Anaerolineae bacterium]